MRRAMMVLILALLMALPNPGLVLASGGANPPPPSNIKIVGPAIKATIVIDPHMPNVTFDQRQGDPVSKGGWATIRMDYKKKSAGAIFRVPNPDSFLFSRGCNLDLTVVRFVFVEGPTGKYNQLTDWISSTTVARLFTDLGLSIGPTNNPVITDVDNVVCTTDPDNPLLPNVEPLPGVLSFDAVIQFVIQR